jgi:5'-3' exonuclease
MAATAAATPGAAAVTMTDRGPLLVVDAPSLLYRAFFALPTTITDGADRPVNALLGALNMIMRVVADYRPRAVVLASGPDAALYRAKAYAPYHSDRPPVPDELAPQFDGAPEFFGAFGWVWAHTAEYEADDLLHSYAVAEERAGGSVLLLTGDRDLFQCASDRTTVLYVKTGTKGVEEVGPAEVRKRYGVAPELVPDFIALRGDPSDGLPGAKGIGEKTAAELLKRHGSLEAALGAWSRERPARVAGALRDQADELRSFKDIATLRDLDVELPPDTDTDFESGARAARERGMEQLAGRLERAGDPA